jgi:hypothetical protein
MIFIFEILFLVFWTWLLNFICSRGYSGVAWFILLFPYILLFMVVLLVASEIKNTDKINKDSKPVAVIAPNNDAYSGLTMRF